MQDTHRVRIYKRRGLGDELFSNVRATSPREDMHQRWTENLHPLPLPPLEKQATTRGLLVQSRSCLSCVQCISGPEVVLDTGYNQRPLYGILHPWPVGPGSGHSMWSWESRTHPFPQPCPSPLPVLCLSPAPSSLWSSGTQHGAGSRVFTMLRILVLGSQPSQPLPCSSSQHRHEYPQTTTL